jgi:hypothetical protein
MRADHRDFDDPLVINLHDKHVADRLPVHVARTEADLQSSIVRHAAVVAEVPLRLVRSKVRRVA